MVFATYDIATLSPTLRGWTREHHVFTMLAFQGAGGTTINRQVLWAPLGVNTFRTSGPLSVKFNWGVISAGGSENGRSGEFFFRLSKVIDDGAGGLIETELLDEYSLGYRYGDDANMNQFESPIRFAQGLEIKLNPKEALCFTLQEVQEYNAGEAYARVPRYIICCEFFSRNA